MQSRQNNLIRRTVLVAVGLVIMAFGVALSLAADLGTSTTTCIPTVLAAYPSIPLTVGVMSIFFNCALILLQILLLRKDFPPIQLLQLAVAFAFGYLTDAMVWVCSFLHLEELFQVGGSAGGYFFRWVICLISILLVGIGVYCEVKADVLMLSGEGFATALAKVTGKPFPKVKVAFDTALVVISAALSLIGLHRLHGVREGTIAAALLVGPVVGFCTKKAHFVDRFLGTAETK